MIRRSSALFVSLFARVAFALPAMAVPSSLPDPTMVVPPDYPEYRALVQLSVISATDPQYIGASIVECPTEQGLIHFSLCADKTAQPQAFVFQDIMGIAGQYLGDWDYWNEHPEAYLPTPPEAQLASNYTKTLKPDLRIPTNRLFEGVLIDANNASRRASMTDWKVPLSMLGRHTNSSAYTVQPGRNLTQYTWFLCKTPLEVKPSNNDSLPYLNDGYGSVPCEDIAVNLRMDILKVLPPIPGRKKTRVESPPAPHWYDDYSPHAHTVDELQYTEELNLVIDSEDPKLDGLDLGLCNPKPFFDLPHIPVIPYGERVSFEGISSLFQVFNTFLPNFFLCANKTDNPTNIIYSFAQGHEWLGRKYNRYLAGSFVILDGHVRKTWNFEDGYIGFHANDTMYRWIGESYANPYGSTSNEFHLCDETYHNKTVRVLYEKDPIKHWDWGYIAPDAQPDRVCTAVGVRKRRTVRVLSEDEVEALYANRDPYGTHDMPDFRNNEVRFGGESFEYHEWLRNLTLSGLGYWPYSEKYAQSGGKDDDTRAGTESGKTETNAESEAEDLDTNSEAEDPDVEELEVVTV